MELAPSGMPGYRIVQEIGRGGMGVVYLARQLSLDRLVAIKVILSADPDVDGSGEYVSRFRREARVLQQLTHPNVVRLIDHDLGAPQPYIVFEYIEGARSLLWYLDKEPPGLSRIMDVAGDIAAGLAHIHENGILHRDLKPGNILLDRAGTAKIIDLGLARRLRAGETCLTQEGQMVGTLCYMPPEQLLGEPVDARCDIYAFGLILYELLVGGHVFSPGAADPVTPMQRFSAPIPAPSSRNPRIAPELDRLLGRCLAKDPASRPADGAQLLRELDLLPAVAAWPAREGRPARPAVAPPDRPGPAGDGRTATGPADLGPSPAPGPAGVSPAVRTAVWSGEELTPKRPLGGPVASGTGRPGESSDRRRWTAAIVGLALLSLGMVGLVVVRRLTTGDGAGRVPGPAAGTPGGPASVFDSAPTGLAELGRELTRRLQSSALHLGGEWLQSFALRHKSAIRKDPGSVAAPLAAHLEGLALPAVLDRFLARAPEYFQDRAIPEADRWWLRWLLCDVELLEEFCARHRIPWPLAHRVAGCAGPWDEAVDPSTFDLVSMKTWGWSVTSGDDRYAPGKTQASTLALPPPAVGDRVLAWYSTLNWRKGLLLDVRVNRRYRALLRPSMPSGPVPPIRVRLVELTGSWGVTRNQEALLEAATEDPRIRNFVGAWIPAGALLARTEVRVAIVDLPLTPAMMQDPSLIDRLITYVPAGAARRAR
ncbi:MAG: protein kinase [Candidatus Riflebacteria bacterium]|nr:protein kinase [Candidatus Riflebacteria bacterium]